MPLYELASRLERIEPTSFAAVGLKERADLQRLLKEQIDVIAPGTLVIAEEFGDWEDAKRRIDLLAVDESGNLVVVELKRTEDGGHADLQALRYAAMVSTMTFQQAADVYEKYLRKTDPDADGRMSLLEFLGWEDDEQPFGESVRIVIASAEFSLELTTSVLWLIKQGIDIRCVRMVPHQLSDRLLLNVEPVIPLPEAADYQVRLRKKEESERAAKQRASRDYTKYLVVTLRDGVTSTYPNLTKRGAMYRLIRCLVDAGAEVQQIADLLSARHRYGPSVMRVVDGTAADRQEFMNASALEGQALPQTFSSRYFLQPSELFHAGGRTYTLTNQWGEGTGEAIQALLEAFPDSGVTCEIDSSAGMTSPGEESLG